MKDSLLAALRERPTFVDLEKVHVGSPAIDLAHATLATSTAWHSDVGKVLSRADGQGFCGLYLENAGKKRAASLQPWLARIDQCFRRETIQSIRSEWMT